MFIGSLGLLVLAGDVWAILNILKSNATDGSKLLWSFLVFILPFLGLGLLYFGGPRN